jgi:type IV secretory pathway VirD2 relaxase
MSADDEINIRPGRIRSKRPVRGRSFVARVLAATQKAGGLHRPGARDQSRSGFGRGRAASLGALRGLASSSRVVVVKARVVRHSPKAAPLATHLAYLRRDGVTRDGAPGKMFDATGDAADARAFAERCRGDRHHFRFIVAPDDAAELSDLRAFTRDLMNDMARDLGTRIDWAAIDHWNTEHPHIHVLVQGRAEDGSDLVISPDYISRGFRARAAQLVTLELGPRSEQEIRRSLERQVDADRWTPLDQALAREAARHDGVVDLRPVGEGAGDFERTMLVARARKLERLGLAAPFGPGQWIVAEEAEAALRALGERADIIKRIHRGLAQRGVERAAANFVLDGEIHGDPIIGRLLSRGLEDELKGTAFAVIDGIDGRAHHLRLKDLDAASDAAIGAVVEPRHLRAHEGRSSRLVLAVRSDLSIEEQVRASGATWLDRRLVAKELAAVSEAGFGREVKNALEARAEHLVVEGLARRQGQRFIFASDLLNTLRQRELASASAQLAAESGLPHHVAAEGESVAGVYRQRLNLASGRWSPSLERELGKSVAGVLSPGGGVNWNSVRKRGVAL